MNKGTKIDWDNIKINIVPADREHPNELNPYAKLSATERERTIVSLCGKIWARHILQKSLKGEAG